MITKDNIVESDQLINKLLDGIDWKTELYLSCDEGGMLGNPRFEIRRNKKLSPYFETVGKMNRNSIRNYILGRLTTWQIGNNTDYSKTITIKVL